MQTQFDAIVIGAGPAGSTAAILLARAGWRVALVEKQMFPRRKVCGECIAASNLPLLNALGIGVEFFRLAGPPLKQVAFMVGAHTVQADFPPYARGPLRWGVALGRAYLDTLLLEQAMRSGVTLFQPWQARHIGGHPGDFYCILQKAHTDLRSTLNAPLLIAAHGSWESAPSSMIGPAGARRWLHQPSDLFAFKAHFTRTQLPRNVLPVLAFPGGYGGMVVGDHDTTTLALCIRRDTLADCRKSMPAHKAADAAFAHVHQACAGVRAALSGACRQGAWLSTGPLRPGIRQPRRAGGIFLVGNAAGEAHPIIGEGISMALQSAWLLAELLAPYRQQIAERQVQARLQQCYLHKWHWHFPRRIRYAAAFAQLAMRPALCRSALPLLQCVPQLLTLAARWSGKVHCAPLQR